MSTPLDLIRDIIDEAEEETINLGSLKLTLRQPTDEERTAFDDAEVALQKQALDLQRLAGMVEEAAKAKIEGKPPPKDFDPDAIIDTRPVTKGTADLQKAWASLVIVGIATKDHRFRTGQDDFAALLHDIVSRPGIIHRAWPMLKEVGMIPHPLPRSSAPSRGRPQAQTDGPDA